MTMKALGDVLEQVLSALEEEMGERCVALHPKVPSPTRGGVWPQEDMGSGETGEIASRSQQSPRQGSRKRVTQPFTEKTVTKADLTLRVISNPHAPTMGTERRAQSIKAPMRARLPFLMTVQGGKAG